VADAVVFFNIDLAPAALALRLMRRARPRLILDLHDYLPTASGRKKLSLIARTFDMVIAISRFSASQLGARSTSAAVLTRPIEPVERWYGLPGGRVVGIVGRVDPDKNLEMAIAAVGHLPEFRLTVRGAPSAAHSSYAADIEVQARAGLGDRVEFTGRLAGAEVFEGFDVLLVTNAAEALGRTVLEAQLRGIVVVVPDEGGAAELVENGETGFTYAAGDPHAAAAAIRKAANSDPLVRENARAVARRSSDPEAYAAAYAGILRGGRA
jgi:glycosyltransferase involved in cell wall biosynthesis